MCGLMATSSAAWYENCQKVVGAVSEYMQACKARAPTQ